MSITEEFNQYIINETIDNGLKYISINGAKGGFSDAIKEEILRLENGIANGTIKTTPLVFNDSAKIPCCDTCECEPVYELPKDL